MTTRNIEQRFWRSPLVPWVEWRSTVQSTQAYKLHQHPQLSIGAIIDGETVTRCSGHEYHLSQGDMVLIAPREAHSCNPAAERPRSYHMLYLDEAWCLQQLGFAPGASSLRTNGVTQSFILHRLYAHYLPDGR